MSAVTNHTRAPRSGRTIYCPRCGTEALVYHFAWAAIPCRVCPEYPTKLEWLLTPPAKITALRAEWSQKLDELCELFPGVSTPSEYSKALHMSLNQLIASARKAGL